MNRLVHRRQEYQRHQSQDRDSRYYIANPVEMKRLRVIITGSELFLKLFEHNPCAISIFDNSGHIVAVNDAFLEIFGNAPTPDYCLFEDPVLLERGFQDLLADLGNGITVTVPTAFWYDAAKTFVTGKDKRVFLSGTGIPILNDLNQVEFVVVVHKDSTEKKIQQNALMESEKKYRELVEQAEIAIMVDDLSGRVLFYNDTLAHLFGYETEEFANKTMLDLVHPDDQATGRGLHIRRIDERQGHFQYEFKGVKKDGSIIYVAVSGTTLIEEGEIAGWRSYMHDITDQKRAEIALRQYNSELESQVENRTIQLREAVENLKQERESLLQKNIALEEVLGQIEDGKKRMAQQIQMNLTKRALPILECLEQKTCGQCGSDIEMLRDCLKDVTSPFISMLDIRFPLLTPRETRICSMIKNGLSSKDIARALNVSSQTIFKQRKSIRKKLGISKKNLNLESYLKLLR